MSTIQPPAGEGPNPLRPPGKQPLPVRPLPQQFPLSPSGGGDQKYAFLLDSPFAKMFAHTGAMPTIQEMKAIIDQILMQQIGQIKKQEAEWKKTMQKMKKAIKGDD